MTALASSNVSSPRFNVVIFGLALRTFSRPAMVILYRTIDKDPGLLQCFIIVKRLESESFVRRGQRRSHKTSSMHVRFLPKLLS